MGKSSKKRRQEGKRSQKPLLIAAGVIIASLACAEAVLRVYFNNQRAVNQVHTLDARIHEYFYFDDDGCFRIRPGVSGWGHSYDGDYDVKVDINAEGLRGPALMARPEKRVVFIGDSITFNGGVPWENTFIELALRKLRRNGQAKQWEFLNLGVTDAGIKEYYLKLKYHALKLKPDMVVIGLYLNDARPPQGFIGENGQQPWEYHIKNSVLYRSYLVKTLFLNFRKIWYSRNPDLLNRFKWVQRYNTYAFLSSEREWEQLLEEARYDWGAGWREDSWETIEKYLGEIRSLCAREKIELRVMFFPAAPQAMIDRPFANLLYPQKKAELLAKKLDIKFLDVLPALKARPQERVFTDQCHLTSAGNAAVAEALAAFLSK